MKKHIPNIITLGNLFCGFAAIFLILTQNNVIYAGYLVLLAGLLDFFDGFVARLLKVSGEMGKQLDSLADMVTFGVVPGFLAWSVVGIDNIWGLVAGLISLFSALRLAKFNIDTRQHDTFIGVPTPMNTLFWVGLVFLMRDYETLTEQLQNPTLFLGLVLFSSFMLVAEFPMLALKFKTLDKSLILKILIFILPSIIALFVWGIGALALIYFHYIFSSLLFKFALK